MRLNHLHIIIFASLVLACSRVDIPAVERQNCCRLNLRADAPWTSKAHISGSPERESTMESLGFLVFDENGVLEKCVFTQGSEALSLTVRCGFKTIWAVANLKQEKFSNVKTISQMEGITLDLEEDFNGVFPMAGSIALEVKKDTELEVELCRFVCRLYVDRIISSLSEELQGKDIIVRTVFMSNVVKNCSLNGEIPENASWINRCGISDSSGTAIVKAGDATCKELTALELERTVCCGDTLSIGSFLYFMPNPVLVDTIDDQGDFTPRYTRAVCVVDIEGDIFYYIINIPLPARNTSYAMSLTIRTPGAIKPETDQYARIQNFGDLDASIWDNFGYLNFEF